MTQYPLHAIIVDDKDPAEVGLIDFDADGKSILTRIVGRKKAQRFLFEQVVARNHITTDSISIEDRNGTRILIYDGTDFRHGYFVWLKEQEATT